MPEKYAHLAEQLDQPNEAFEEFFADMVKRIPALQGRGPVDIPVAGFKKALKAAYIIGGADTLEQLLKQDS